MLFRNIKFLTPTPLGPKSVGDDVAEVFRKDTQLTLCPVVDDAGRLLGCVSRTVFLKQITGHFGRALYGRKPVRQFFSESVQVRRLNESLTDLLSDIDLDQSEILRDGIGLVDENQIFVGVLPGLRILSQMHQLHSEMVAELKNEVQERKTAEEKVRLLANTDALTGTLNRRAFREAIDKVAPNANSIGCAYLDLDGFKQLNDQYGHSIGDLMLATVAQRLQSMADDLLVSRLGGDEFTIVAIDCDVLEFQRLCERAYRAIKAPKMTDIGPVCVGASIGWSLIPDDTNSISSLIHNADKAMLKIKAQGGGIARFHPDHLDQRVVKQA